VLVNLDVAAEIIDRVRERRVIDLELAMYENARDAHAIPPLVTLG
jgi:hypothetical protein